MADVTMEWLMDDSLVAGAGLSLAKMTVGVGVTSEAHFHSNCTEVIHVLEGEIEQRIGDNWQALKEGESCFIPKGQVHQTKNIGNLRAVMMIAYSEGQRNYQTL
jgi:quercetin dioxygenase-like cupin family protein